MLGFVNNKPRENRFRNPRHPGTITRDMPIKIKADLSLSQPPFLVCGMIVTFLDRNYSGGSFVDNERLTACELGKNDRIATF